MPLIETKYRYSVGEDSTFDRSYKLMAWDWEQLTFDLDEDYDDLEDLAERCAEDFHSEHDGWERSSWVNDSIVIKVWKDENTSVSFDVYLEYTPSFSATRTS